MNDLALIQETERLLDAIKTFDSTSNNEQLLDYIERLESALRALTSAGDTVPVHISGSTAAAIGRDLNLMVHQVHPPAARQALENVLIQWSAAHPQVRTELERSQQGHIFLSYTRSDIEAALQIRRALEQAGHIVWQDLTAIKGGEDWIQAIEDGVERCYALIAVVSERWQTSKWVRIEYLQAERRHKLVVPIKVDACEIPILLLATNVIPGFPDLNAGIHQLLASLPEHPALRTGAPVMPRRALELCYLDGLLLKHSVWQEVYTPMAGVGRLDAPRERRSSGVHMKTTPTTIDVIYLGQKFTERGRNQEVDEQSVTRQYPVDITQAVEEMHQLVILGDPGAGKTTTLWKILSDHALKAKNDPEAPLPVLVQLGSLGSGGIEGGIRAQLGSLIGYYADLLQEKRLVFLLDGLNEMKADSRAAIVPGIQKLAELCQKADLILAVTCRELDYTYALNLGLPGRVTIQPLDPVRVQRFVSAYIVEPGKGDELFWQLAGGPKVENVWRKWKQAGASFESFWSTADIPKERPNVHSLTTGQDDEIWRLNVRERGRSMLALAANPYLLFMITKVFTEAGVLPPNRGFLFQAFIDYLLEQRERLSAGQATELKNRLANLAFTMQAEGQSTTFTTGQVMEHMRDEQSLYHARGASILAGGDKIRFTHQLLQEYFAAYHLQTLMTKRKAEQLYPERNWWERQGWEETLMLLVGLYSDDCSPLIEWLQNAQPELAAHCITESGAHYPPEKLALLSKQWTPRLTDLKRDPVPQARAAIGRALGSLQVNGQPLDRRKGVSILQAGQDALPDIGWIEIPAGKFTYQENVQRKESHFFMARYPITFAQFQAFLDDPQGFTQRRWWAGLSADANHRRAPDEQAFRLWNHPRERVSWYDAVAFCRWLTDKAQTHHQLLPQKLREQAHCVISLPTEWQWEKAAQGKMAREYPYEGKFDAAKANTSETRIGQTSAVGIFPQGASPYGVMDMCGNVWEWCLNGHDNPENIDTGGSEWRVVRGGSWDNNQDAARTTFRRSNGPSRRSFNLGFRVVVYASSG